LTRDKCGSQDTYEEAEGEETGCVGDEPSKSGGNSTRDQDSSKTEARTKAIAQRTDEKADDEARLPRC